MSQFEARIRDYLAQNLGVVEGGLSLVQKEFKLENISGASGYIDILARDELGHYVVIEIKRSNQAARAALHELTKYVALLKSTLGIRPEQIRALLLSTEWHELASSFGEYQRICEVPTTGYRLFANQTGEVTRAEPYDPPVFDQPLKISRQQHVFLFEDHAQRDAMMNKVVAAAERAMLKDYALLAVDYEGGNERVIHPHGTYIIFSSPMIGADRAAEEEIKNGIDWDDDLDDLDENFLCALMEVIEYEHDSSEIGYPEKLASMESLGWKISVAQRFGRYAENRTLLPDEDLIAEAKKEEGGNNHFISRTASPRYAPSWGEFKDGVNLVLLGNTEWLQLFAAIVRDIEVNMPNATVSIHVYNVADTAFSLAKMFGERDARWVPSFQLVVTHKDDVDFYSGQFVWSGRPAPLQAIEWINKCFGSIERYFTTRHFGEQFSEDDKARRLLGLSCQLLHVRKSGKDSANKVMGLKYQGQEVVYFDFNRGESKGLVEFYRNNQRFGATLVEEFTSRSFGLINAN